VDFSNLPPTSKLCQTGSSITRLFVDLLPCWEAKIIAADSKVWAHVRESQNSAVIGCYIQTVDLYSPTFRQLAPNEDGCDQTTDNNRTAERTRNYRVSKQSGKKKAGKSKQFKKAGGGDGDDLDNSNDRGCILEPERNWACPFYKLDPNRYSRCGALSLSELSHVKQHIKRTHTAEYCCPSCLWGFRQMDDWIQHVQGTSCAQTIVPGPTNDDFSIQEYDEFKFSRLGAESSTPESKWYSMWGRFFAGHPEPDSPYVLVNLLDEFRATLRNLGPGDPPAHYRRTLPTAPSEDHAPAQPHDNLVPVQPRDHFDMRGIGEPRGFDNHSLGEFENLMVGNNNFIMRQGSGTEHGAGDFNAGIEVVDGVNTGRYGGIGPIEDVGNNDMCIDPQLIEKHPEPGFQDVEGHQQ